MPTTVGGAELSEPLVKNPGLEGEADPRVNEAPISWTPVQGEAVVARGLVQAAHLNGQTGVITGPPIVQPDGVRWPVHVGGQIYKFKLDNIARATIQWTPRQGETVIARGLVQVAHLNGQRGVITGPRIDQPDGARWPVKFGARGYNLKLENMQRAGYGQAVVNIPGSDPMPQVVVVNGAGRAYNGPVVMAARDDPEGIYCLTCCTLFIPIVGCFGLCANNWAWNNPRYPQRSSALKMLAAVTVCMFVINIIAWISLVETGAFVADHDCDPYDDYDSC